VFGCVAVTVTLALVTGHRWLQRPALVLGLLTLCQIGLGMAAWVTKFGLPSIGYVAVQRTFLQTAVRTSHTVVGMMLLASSVILVLRLLRCESLRRAASSVQPVGRTMGSVTDGGLLNGVRPTTLKGSLS
jgi:hypothetical protein